MARKREFLIGGTLLIIATAAFLLGWTNLFTVKEIVVSGAPNDQISAQVLQLAEINKGQKLARIEPRTATSKLESAGLNWVSSVKITRNWISRKVSIEIQPREAIAKLAGADGKYLDKSGTTFALPAALAKSGLDNLPSIRATDTATQKAAIDFYQNLPAEIKAHLIEVSASSRQNFQINLEKVTVAATSGGQLKINWGSASDFALKVKIYKALLALPENGKITSMDLSNPNAPTVK